MRISPRIDEWVKLYAGGMSVWAIAAQYGVSAPAVHAGIKRRGVQCRTISEAHTGMRCPWNSARQRKHVITNESAFERIDTEEKAYWLGFLMADGCVMVKAGSHRRHTLQVTLAEMDKSHLERFGEFIGATDYPIQVVHPKPPRQTTHSLAVISEKLVNDLIAVGCVPRKTTILEFPFTHVPSQLMRHLVRGFFDGDGTVTRFHGDRPHSTKASFACAAPNFVEGLCRTLLSDAGIVAGTYKIKRNKAFEVNVVRQEHVGWFYHYLYDNATVYLERKKCRFEELLGLDVEAG